MSGIIDEIKQSFTQGNSLTKLIYINLAVFVLVNIIPSISSLFVRPGFEIHHWFSLPADLGEILYKPWTLFTYMFLHKDFMHVLMNILWLYFLGKIFQDLLGEKRLVSTYILGGLSGAVLYILAYNLFPVFSEVLPFATAMGASASVMAIIIAIATKAPNYIIRLIFIGDVRLKYIALVFVVLDMISLGGGNAGGHIAHLGGALFGFSYIKGLDSGIDASVGFYKWVSVFSSLFSFKKNQKVKVIYKNKSQTKTQASRSQNNQEMVDTILDKISRSGYDSLSKEEKDILFRASQNN